MNYTNNQPGANRDSSPPLFSHITEKCFINVPFNRLVEESAFIIANRIQPEIGLEGDVLYSRSAGDFEAIARKLKAAGLSCTLHAPFFDLAPGALDREVLAASRAKLARAFALIPVFEPASIVCHLNYEDNKHGHQQSEWFARSLETWQEMLAVAERYRTPLMLENTYESGPAMHQAMLGRLDSPYARFCLDVGHVQAFAGNRWQDWLPALEPWLGQLHLHDNHGERDEHVAIGSGTFTFEELFSYLARQKLAPVITLEPHTEEGMWQSLRYLDRMPSFQELIAGG